MGLSATTLTRFPRKNRFNRMPQFHSCLGIQCIGQFRPECVWTWCPPRKFPVCQMTFPFRRILTTALIWSWRQSLSDHQHHTPAFHSPATGRQAGGGQQVCGVESGMFSPMVAIASQSAGSAIACALGMECGTAQGSLCCVWNVDLAKSPDVKHDKTKVNLNSWSTVPVNN